MKKQLLMIAFLCAACSPTTMDRQTTMDRNATRPANAGAPPPPLPVETPSGPYAFYGLEGDWGGVFLDERIYLDSPSSAGWYSRPITTHEIPPGGAVVRAGDITATIEDGGCADPVLRAGNPDRVLVNWDGGVHVACGGWRDNAAGLAGTTWQVMQVGDVRAPSSRPPAATLAFRADGRMGGAIDCNDGGIDATWTNGGFDIVDPAVSQTAMGCPDDANLPFAEGFWALMGEAERWDRDGDLMTITFADGTTAKLRRLL